MDRFKYFNHVNGVQLEVKVPVETNKMSTLRCVGLTDSSGVEIFWVNSKYCKLTLNKKLIGELFYVGS